MLLPGFISIGININGRNIIIGGFILAHFDKDRLLEILRENGVSEHNQQVVVRYIMAVKRECPSPVTAANASSFMKWLALNFQGDLDKITVLDLEEIRDMIGDMTRKRDNKPVAGSTKTLWQTQLKKFLKSGGELFKNPDMIELSKFKISKVKSPQLQAKDVLTEEEIDKMIAVCTTLRDRALIAVMYETGARVGEIENCKIEDVVEMPHGYDIMLRGKTGERPSSIYKYQQLLKQYMSSHFDYHNPKAPLFPTLRRYNEYSVTGDISKKDEPRDFRQLDSKMIGEIIKVTAERAGIKKRVYPHLLRHSQATFLAANNVGEQHMKQIMGWRPNSPMCGTYTHITNLSSRNAKLAAYGHVVKDSDSKEVEKCPRCNKPITVGLKYCECGMPLTVEGMKSYHRLMKDNDFILKMIQLNQELGTILDGEIDEEKLKMVRDNGW